MQKNKICTGKVYCFKFYVDSNWGMQTHNYNPTSKLNIRIKYKVCTDHYSKIGTKWISEEKLFETKEKLINSINDKSFKK